MITGHSGRACAADKFAWHRPLATFIDRKEPHEGRWQLVLQRQEAPYPNKFFFYLTKMAPAQGDFPCVSFSFKGPGWMSYPGLSRITIMDSGYSTILLWFIELSDKRAIAVGFLLCPFWYGWMGTFRHLRNFLIQFFYWSIWKGFQEPLSIPAGVAG